MQIKYHAYAINLCVEGGRGTLCDQAAWCTLKTLPNYHLHQYLDSQGQSSYPTFQKPAVCHRNGGSQKHPHLRLSWDFNFTGVQSLLNSCSFFCASASFCEFSDMLKHSPFNIPFKLQLFTGKLCPFSGELAYNVSVQPS